MLTLKKFVFNPFQENTYLLYDESNECIVIDPGMSNEVEREELDSFIEENSLTPAAIVNTHCHIDHILGCRHLKEKYAIPFLCNQLEVPLLENAKAQGEFFGLEVDSPPAPDSFLSEEKNFLFGNSTIILLHVPGHSQGSLSLYNRESKIVITGDALFNGSIGRTDLPGGDYTTLISSIRTKLLTLPREIEVFPGHGPSTSIGAEHDTNPFLK